MNISLYSKSLFIKIYLEDHKILRLRSVIDKTANDTVIASEEDILEDPRVT